MKLLVIANSLMVLPVLQMAADQNWSVVVAHGPVEDHVKASLQVFCSRAGICCVPLVKEGWDKALASIVVQHNIQLAIVFTFPWLIPDWVLNIPQYGFLNIHPGPLPEMRGADPVFETIRQSLPLAGLTIHRMFGGFDAGNIVDKFTFPIRQGATYGMLSRHISIAAAARLQIVVENVLSTKQINEVPQLQENAMYYKKISEDELCPDPFNMSSVVFTSLVKAANPVVRNGLPIMLSGLLVNICNVSEVALSGDAGALPAGTILAVDRTNGLIILCADGKAVNVDVIYTEDGYMPGYYVENYGVLPGMIACKAQKR